MTGKHTVSVTPSQNNPAGSGPDGSPLESPKKKLRITIKKTPPECSESAQKPGGNDAGCSGCNDYKNLDPRPIAPAVFTRQRSLTIHDLFQVQKLLGEGGFGKVYMATRRRDHAVVALKAIPIQNRGFPLLSSASDIFEESLQREVAALIALSEPGHPHVCRLYDSPLRDNSHSYLAMEYIGGGELFEHLCNRGPFSERDAAKFLCQFADALHYIHSKNYVHSDLKPENLMMGSWQEGEARLKVVDFGFSVPDRESIKLPYYGTVAYLPPECLVMGHSGRGVPWHPTAAGDMFAAGVIVYTVLTGTHPFDRTNHATDSVIANAVIGSLACISNDNTPESSAVDNSDKDTMGSSQKINEYLDAHVFDDRTKGLSPSSISMMRDLLHPDPTKRMTSSQFRCHPWVLGKTAATHCLSPGHHTKLKEFWQRRFRAAILQKFWGVRRLHGKQQRRGSSLTHNESEVIFRSMDLNGDGTVSLDELKRSILSESSSAQLGFDAVGDGAGGNKIKKYMLDDLFSSVDEDGSGGIDLEEFKRAMAKKKDGGESKDRNGDTTNNVPQSAGGNHNENDERKLEISNEQVRGCIFQKFGVFTKDPGGAIKKSNIPITRKTLRTIFDTMDLNKDGFLQLSEAITVLKETPELDEDMISIWADKADIDLNGEIDFEEFCMAMTGGSLRVSEE